MNFTMNSGGALQTAILRGFYQALGSGTLVFLITWGTTDQLKGPIIGGCVAALGALGFRGGVEGSLDAQRQKNGDVKPSDVSANT